MCRGCGSQGYALELGGKNFRSEGDLLQKALNRSLRLFLLPDRAVVESGLEQGDQLGARSLEEDAGPAIGSQSGVGSPWRFRFVLKTLFKNPAASEGKRHGLHQRADT